MPSFSAHFISFSLMYSGPLSTRMVPGLPRHSMLRRVRKRSGRPFPRRRVQTADHALCGQGKVHLNPEPFAVEVVEHVQQMERPSVTQPVGHEVPLRRLKANAYRATHRPGRIWCLRHHQGIRFVALQPLARLDLLPGNGLPSNRERAQVQLQLAGDPPYGDCRQSPIGQWINPFVVPWMPLHIAQMQKTQAEPPRLAGVS